jgi:protein-S-isoprenylcysteine O-methyltransferase
MPFAPLAHLDALTRLAFACGLVWTLSEVRLMWRQRSRRTGARGQDRGSLFWIILPAAGGIALAAIDLLLFPYMPFAIGWRWLGLVLWAAGLGLRRWSIAVLGRFFTVDVSIHGEQRLIEDGPYRWLRHPSYTGFSLILAGLGLLAGKWTTVGLLLLTPAPGLFWRLRVEEAALHQAFGDAYAAYARRTWRLFPGLY